MNKDIDNKGSIKIEGVDIGCVVSFELTHHRSSGFPPVKSITGQIKLKLNTAQHALILSNTKFTFELFEDLRLAETYPRLFPYAYSGTATILKIHKANALECNFAFAVVKDDTKYINNKIKGEDNE